ncbi:MAG: hypothetical protein AB7G93_22635 [Bdellovibrionales bacterium]
MSRRGWVCVCVGMLLSLGCSVKKDAEEMKQTTKEMKETTDRMSHTMEDMNETTKEMNETTKKMNETSGEIKNHSEHLAKRTDDLESELTNKESFRTMRESLDSLFGRDENFLPNADGGLNVGPDLIFFASAAVQSMYFQFWKGDYHESVEVLDRRMELAADMLFDRASKHIPRDFEVDVMIPGRSYMAVASLGVRLEDVRPEFTESLKRAGMTPFTFYDVVLQALRNRGRLARKELLQKSIKKILEWKQEAIYMLQLRHNYLPLLVLGRITGLQDRGWLGNFWTGMVGETVDISQMDPEQLRLWTLWLRRAAQTRAQLHAIGIEPVYNSSLQKLVDGVDFGQQALLATPVEGMNETQRLQREFAEAYVRIQTGARYLPVSDLESQN